MTTIKKLPLNGDAEIFHEGNSITINAYQGLVTVMVGCNEGSAVWLYHPLSGWYIEQDYRDGKTGSIEVQR